MRLLIRNSSIVVEGYEWGSCPIVERNFRMYDMVTHSEYYIGLYYDEDNKKLYLPRGIDIWFLEKYLEVEHEMDYKCDDYAEIPEFFIKYMPRDDVQKQSLRFMIGEGEYTDNRYRSQLSVNLNTGKGKTYVSIATLIYERKRSIIITYANEWLRQWKKCILDYTNAAGNDVYQISGAPSINMLLSGKSIHSNHSIYLVTHATIKSYASAYGWDKITKLFDILHIGFKFYDEAHLNFTNMCMIDFFTNTFRTYYITATPARSSDEENKIFQLYLKNIPSIELFDAEEDPHTSYISLMYNSMPTPYDISSMKNAYGLDINKYCNWVISQEAFYNICHVVLDMVFRMCGRTGKAMFFIHTNEAVMQVYDWLMQNYPELEGLVGIYTSLAENKAKEKEKRFILTTIKSAGAAVDIKGLKVAVVIADPFKSKVNAKQILGRTRAEDTFLIELIDLGFYQIKKWYYSKLGTYQKYAVDTREVLLRSNELIDRSQAILDGREWRSAPFYMNKGWNNCVAFRDKGPVDCVIFHRHIL